MEERGQEQAGQACSESLRPGWGPQIAHRPRATAMPRAVVQKDVGETSSGASWARPSRTWGVLRGKGGCWKYWESSRKSRSSGLRQAKPKMGRGI